MKLFPHQIKSLDLTKNYNRCAYYLDMGLGKTFAGAEKMIQLGSKLNLIVCQKSKIDDWINHFVDNYELAEDMMIYDLAKWNKDNWQSLEEWIFVGGRKITITKKTTSRNTRWKQTLMTS